jgi:hypothetical protein
LLAVGRLQPESDHALLLRGVNLDRLAGLSQGWLAGSDHASLRRNAAIDN